MTVAARQARLSVLLVDEDRRVRTALVRLLAATDPDWEVWAVPDLAFAPPTTELPDVALIDVPGGDADPALAVIAWLSGAGVPVLAISAVDGRRQQAIGAGASMFVSKDANTELLVQAVRSAVTATGTASSPPSPTSADSGYVPTPATPEVNR